MNETPRTDSQVFTSDFSNRGNEAVQASFSRQLERELAEAGENIKTSGALLQSFERRLTAMTADRDRWQRMCEEAIHALRCANNSFAGSPEGQEQIDSTISQFKAMKGKP